MNTEKQNIESFLSQGQTIQLAPEGYSMYPIIVPGRDLVLIKKTDISQLKRGDVVLYRRPQSILVLHRIYKRTHQGFYFVGDNQVEIEGPLSEDVILGTMVAFIRKGRTISVDNFLYKATALIWLRLRPFRPVISHAVAKLKRLFKH